MSLLVQGSAALFRGEVPQFVANSSTLSPTFVHIPATATATAAISPTTPEVAAARPATGTSDDADVNHMSAPAVPPTPAPSTHFVVTRNALPLCPTLNAAPRLPDCSPPAPLYQGETFLGVYHELRFLVRAAGRPHPAFVGCGSVYLSSTRLVLVATPCHPAPFPCDPSSSTRYPEIAPSASGPQSQSTQDHHHHHHHHQQQRPQPHFPHQQGPNSVRASRSDIIADRASPSSVAFGTDPHQTPARSDSSTLSIPLAWFRKDKLYLRRPFFDRRHFHGIFVPAPNALATAIGQPGRPVDLRIEMIHDGESKDIEIREKLLELLADPDKVAAESKRLRLASDRLLVPSNVHYAFIDPMDPTYLILGTHMVPPPGP